MFRYISITLLFSPLMFCDTFNHYQRQGFVDTVKSTYAAVEKVADTTKFIVENIKSGVDVAKDIIGTFSTVASFTGPVGAAFSAVGGVLSEILGIAFPGGKSKELEEIEELKHISKEGFEKMNENIQRLEKEMVKGFKATLARIDELQEKMNDGFGEVIGLITEENELIIYNEHRESVTKVYAPYELFLKEASVSNLETAHNDFQKLKTACTLQNPENALNWFYKKTVEEADLISRNFLYFFKAKYENNTVTFTNFLSIVAYDVLTALEMTSVCNGIQKMSGTTTAQNKTRDILTKINQLIQERKQRYNIDTALEYAKNFQMSCNGPAINLPTKLNTERSEEQHKAEQYFIRFHNETNTDRNSFVQRNLKAKFPWYNWTIFTIWYDKDIYNNEAGRQELVDTVKSVTCSFSGRLVVHAVPSNVVISEEFREASDRLDFYANTFSLSGAECPTSQNLAKILYDMVGKQFLVAIYFNLLDAKQPVTYAATHFVLLKGIELLWSSADLRNWLNYYN